MASSRPFQRKSIRGQKGTILTEVVVIQGKVDGSYQSSRSIPSDDELEGSIEVHSKHLQICKAQGSKLLKAVEILEPANFSLVLSNTSFSHDTRSDSMLSRDSLSVHGLITKDLDETSVLEAQIILTQFSITIINDLQGVNPALFKIGMENILFGMNMVLPIVCGDKLHSEAIIESILHTSFTVDYFDSTSNRKEPAFGIDLLGVDNDNEKKGCSPLRN